MTTDMFISTVRKYTRAKKLTPRMLNELIDRIEVYQAEKVSGEWVQKLTIHYNCVGVIFIPDMFPLPVPSVSVNTRKGVIVNYAHAKSQYKKRVFLQLFKCCKNTRHGPSDRT